MSKNKEEPQVLSTINIREERILPAERLELILINAYDGPALLMRRSRKWPNTDWKGGSEGVLLTTSAARHLGYKLIAAAGTLFDGRIDFSMLPWSYLQVVPTLRYYFTPTGDHNRKKGEKNQAQACIIQTRPAKDGTWRATPNDISIAIEDIPRFIELLQEVKERHEKGEWPPRGKTQILKENKK